MTNAERPVADRLAVVVFALLVVACIAAFFITQRLKHTPTVVQDFKLTPVFSPTPAGHIKQEHISFKLAHADQVTVTIEDSNGAEVATLVRDLPVSRYKPVSLRWNGHLGEAHGYTVISQLDGYTSIVPTINGALAPAGEYRVRVDLRNQRRSVQSPRSFTLKLS